MAEYDIRALVHDLYGAYERRDFDRVIAFLHDDIDWIINAPVRMFSFAGRRQGRKAVLEALGSIAAEYQLENYKPQIVIVEGNRAAVLSNVRFVQRSTSRVMRFQIVNFLRFQEDKVIEFREFTNTLELAEQVSGRYLS